MYKCVCVTVTNESNVNVFFHCVWRNTSTVSDVCIRDLWKTDQTIFEKIFRLCVVVRSRRSIHIDVWRASDTDVWRDGLGRFPVGCGLFETVFVFQRNVVDDSLQQNVEHVDVFHDHFGKVHSVFSFGADVERQ